MIKYVIVSQVQKIAEGEAEKFVISTKVGNITILSGHTDLISLLEFGFVTIKAQEETSLLIKQGLLSVSKDNLLILADDAVMIKSLLQHDIDKAISSAQKDLSLQQSFSPELIQLEKQLKFEMFKRNFIQNSI